MSILRLFDYLTCRNLTLMLCKFVVKTYVNEVGLGRQMGYGVLFIAYERVKYY